MTDNRNMPVYPTPYDFENDRPMADPPGLTKLEYAAIQAMAGQIACYTKMELGAEVIATTAVACAKALFDELESNNG